MTCIRPARSDDLPALQVVERRAGEMFRPLGMEVVAEDGPPTLERLAVYQRAGRAWVAEDRGEVVGYLLLDVVAGCAHIEQVSVDPTHARQRVGARLIESATQWAIRHGLTSMTLTSFEHVPWNAPFYATLGFVVVPDEDQSLPLRAIRRAEKGHGHGDAWPRVAMRRQLDD